MRDRSFGVAQLLPLVLLWRQVAVAVPLSGDSFQAKEIRTISTPGVQSRTSSLAITHNGSHLLVMAPHAIHVFSVANGSRLWTIGSSEKGAGVLQFNDAYQVYIASDGYVFVAEYGNHRVQVLTPGLGFHGYFTDGLEYPCGVVANVDIVVVTGGYKGADRITVFNRSSGKAVRHIGSKGSGNGQLLWPRGLYLLPGDRHIAVVDTGNHRVSVFDVNNTWIPPHLGVGVLNAPQAVAFSAFGEIVVADRDNFKLRLLNATTGALLPKSFDTGGRFTGVVIHGSRVFAQDQDAERCVVFA
jgi:DNA-binding beta-propeller fold protein YncE